MRSKNFHNKREQVFLFLLGWDADANVCADLRVDENKEI